MELKDLVEEIKKLSLVQVSELVKMLEEEFGVSAAAAVVAGPSAGAAAEVEEKTEFNVVVTAFDAAKKIAAIKVVRELTGLGLGDAKALLEGSANAPAVIKENIAKSSAEEAKNQLVEAGCTVELK